MVAKKKVEPMEKEFKLTTAIVGVALAGIVLAGCTNSTPDIDTPTPEENVFVHEDTNTSVEQKTAPTTVDFTIDESKIPSGFTLVTNPTEQEINEPSSESINSEEEISKNWENGNKTCFIGVNVSGKVINDAPEGSLTDYAVADFTQYLPEGSYKVSAATVPSSGTPLEVKVIDFSTEVNKSFTALRVFDSTMPTSMLSQTGEPLTGNKTLTVSYSCDASEPEVTVAQFQELLNSLTVNYK